MSHYFSPTGQTLIARPAYAGLGADDFWSRLGTAGKEAGKFLVDPFRQKLAATIPGQQQVVQESKTPGWVVPVVVGGIALTAVILLTRKKKS